jgi:hypothetical protein
LDLLLPLIVENAHVQNLIVHCFVQLLVNVLIFTRELKNRRLFLPLLVENAHVQNINQNVNCFVLLPSINVLIFSSQLKREG